MSRGFNAILHLLLLFSMVIPLACSRMFGPRLLQKGWSGERDIQRSYFFGLFSLSIVSKFWTKIVLEKVNPESD
jgi:hypothetical protein